MYEICGIPIREVQKKMLEILLYFDDFCKKNNLTYFLCGGCLIGAVRNKGFIPWDDDIDLFMPRSDYERLAEIWDKKADTKKYRFCRTNQYEVYHDGGASIRDVNTTEINRHSVDDDICHGMAIELMPIDGCPKSKIKRTWQLINAGVFSLFNVQRLPNNKGKFLRFLSAITYKIIRSNKTRYKIWKKAEKRMTQYKWEDCDEVTELIGSIRGMLMHHPKKDFESVAFIDFEGYKFPAMVGYDRYLKKIWGNYMELPPENQRVPKHDLVKLDINVPYKKFKGVYYCTK